MRLQSYKNYIVYTMIQKTPFRIAKRSFLYHSLLALFIPDLQQSVQSCHSDIYRL